MQNVSFGNRILILILMILLISVLSSAYLMHTIKNSELSMLETQKAKLEEAALLFDQSISKGLDEYIGDQGLSDAARTEQIQVLGQMINEKVGIIKENYPEIHIGIYCNRLDVFYDGTMRFGENFSMRRKNAFDEVISTRQTVVNDLGPEAGGVVEVYRPFIRDGKLEGVIRSAIYLADTGYYGKRKEIETTIYIIIGLVLFTGIGGAMILFRQFVSQVQNIKAGVKKLEDDLSNTLPPAPGELGEIVSAINGLALKIAYLNLYNEKMLESIDDAIVVVDNSGRVVITNYMAEMIFNIENAGNAHYSLILPKGAPFAGLVRDTLSEGKHYKDLQVDWISGSHMAHNFLVSTSTLADNRGDIIGAVLTCRDITERIKLEERVRLQERLASLGKLVAGVAHEIRNPLTSISCYIQHWQEQNIKPNSRALATMYREVARLDSIVDQLLYFAKPAEAKLSFNDINVTIENVLAFFTDINQGRYNLVRDLKPGLPKVLMDTEQIERVIVNIMFNALQALPEEGTVKISSDLGPEEDTVEISIEDNGCGIPQENIVHLFDPFYSTRPKGTGLGLAIVYEIIKAHRGNVKVDSEVGRGTKFSFYLKTREDV
ncbi:MAG: two-component system sensor histidine kinase AtoS [Bacillota bacterium]